MILVTNADYCQPLWESGKQCTGAPLSIFDWIFGISLTILIFLALMKLISYAITGILSPFNRPHHHSTEYEKQFQMLRPNVLRRDGHRCVICGRFGTSANPLHVHHITPRSQGGENSMSNLVTLCAHHHQEVHHKHW